MKLLAGLAAGVVGVFALVVVVAALLGDGGEGRGLVTAGATVTPDVIPTPPPPRPHKREKAGRKPRDPEPTATPTPVATYDPVIDPFGYEPDKRADFERRAAAGNAHILYALSPGGVLATARRVARFRPQIERAAAKAGVSADRLEALVFLESAGRPAVISPQGITGAVGLTQIVASTGTGLLAMPIDVERSIKLTQKIALARSEKARRKLIGKRMKADPRFDVAKELAASGRYLSTAENSFGDEDLAFVSYHMGIGNLQGVLDAYGAGSVPYTQLYFDSSPTRHAAAWARLFNFNDDSSRYFFKLNAAQNIMAEYRTDRQALVEMAALQTGKDSAEDVLHPPDRTATFPTAAAVAQSDDLLTVPRDTRATGLRVPPGARLRPEALATALYIGARVGAGSGSDKTFLRMSTTTRPGTLPDLHSTGFAFDILRRYRSDAQARAFQAVLDRLQSLNLIAYTYEDDAIHIVAADDASAFEPLLDRVR